MSDSSPSLRCDSEEDRAGVPITFGLKAKAPFGMSVEAKIMTQATEKWALKAKHIRQRLGRGKGKKVEIHPPTVFSE
jgi:hypothetical protein